MTRRDRTEYLVLREFREGEPDDLEAVFDRIREAVAGLRDDGIGLEWLASDTLAEDGEVVATLDRFQADTHEALSDHADRAGVPLTRVWTVADSREGARESRRKDR